MAVRFHVRKDIHRERRSHDRRRRGISATVSAALLIAFALILRHFTILYMQEETSFSMFSTSEDDSTPEQSSGGKQMAAENVPSIAVAAVPVDVIVAPNVASFTLESSPMQDMMSAEAVDLSLSDALAVGDLGGGSGGDAGEVGSGNGGMGGAGKLKSALVGTLYDLKTLRNGEPSPLSTSEGNLEMLEVLSEFYRKNWRRSILDKYRASPVNLYATCFYMPNCMDSEAPIAFQVADSMEPSRWVAVYRGRIRPPKSGRFRFWGVADSLMAVRLNRKNVLQCGFHTLSDRQAEWNTHRYDAFLNNRKVVSYPETKYWKTLFAMYADEMRISRPSDLSAKISLTLKNFPKKQCRVVGEAEVPIFSSSESGPLDPGAVREREQVGTKTIELRQCQIVGYEDKKVEIKSQVLDSMYAMRHDVMELDNLPGGFENGEEMRLDSTKWYDIEVMISEIGGGNFGFCLLIEDLDDPSPLHKNGYPLFQLFRTMPVTPDPQKFYEEVHTKITKGEQTFPPYDPDSIIFDASN